MNCLFIVQGEGRGHMTQALALSQILREAGHTISGVLIGNSRRRTSPAFFLRKIGAPVESFSSPNFETGRDEQSILFGQTVAGAVRRIPAYLTSLNIIEERIDRYRPDLVVNFYEPLAGVYYRLRRPATPMVAIAHQYLVHHEEYPFPNGTSGRQRALRAFTDITGMGAIKRLALSFYSTTDIPSKRTTVVPPLLRAEVLRMRGAEAEPFLLAYVLNRGYADHIVNWHTRRPDTPIHCFWDNRDAPAWYRPAKNLTFHHLDDRKFISMMASCRGLICTAGFESICEAMYLGKPVMMVPVEGHFEQACNALDASRVGAGMASDAFDIDAFLEYIAYHEPPPVTYRDWVESGPSTILEQLEAAADLPISV